MQRRYAENGFALLAVLWGVALLALIATAIITGANSSARIDRLDWRVARARAMAETLANGAILSLMDSRPESTPRVDGTVQPIFLNKGAAALSIQDEAGKIDINFADAPTLQSLFQAGGMAESDAKAVADQIAANRSASGEITYHTIDEMRAVPGISAKVYAAIAPLITTYAHTSTIDRNVAPRPVLQVLPGIKAEDIDMILSQRKKLAPSAVASGHAFNIRAVVDNDGVRASADVVVVITGDYKSLPYLIEDWR